MNEVKGSKIDHTGMAKPSKTLSATMLKPAISRSDKMKSTAHITVPPLTKLYSSDLEQKFKPQLVTDLSQLRLPPRNADEPAVISLSAFCPTSPRRTAPTIARSSPLSKQESLRRIESVKELHTRLQDLGITMEIEF
eukprot:GILK01012342.1.p1 GENE.GILK01012342.1~~GILK01012342.1.p1  ORF type:complete len:137 (-),score=17.74 GILK01012342.1:535-945(-)